MRVKQFGEHAGSTGSPWPPPSPSLSEFLHTLWNSYTKPLFSFYEVTTKQMSKRKKERLHVAQGLQAVGTECISDAEAPLPFPSPPVPCPPQSPVPVVVAVGLGSTVILPSESLEA